MGPLTPRRIAIPCLMALATIVLASCGDPLDRYNYGSTGSPTALCEDGTHSYSESCTDACADNGGVTEWYISGCGGDDDGLTNTVAID